jgi:hypothetical protein
VSNCCNSSIAHVDSGLTRKDRLGMFMCRISNRRRSNYVVDPGLYAVGSPGNLSPIFVSANYKFSFDILRLSVRGIDCYILVLDTKGVNVWCAAGKGTFGTDELVSRIKSTQLADAVQHRRIIVPQLGAVGVAGYEVKERTGFTVVFGPVDAKDIPEFLNSKMKATKEMRRIRFNWKDRIVLTPMELVPASKWIFLILAVLFILGGLDRSGILFRPAFEALKYTGTALLAGLVCGGFLGPLLLPLLPFRSFALKGLFIGLLYPIVLSAAFFPSDEENIFLFAAACIAAPAISSYITVNFTGSSTVTGISGVEKELKTAMPLYKASAVAVSILVLVGLFKNWAFF